MSLRSGSRQDFRPLPDHNVSFATLPFIFDQRLATPLQIFGNQLIMQIKLPPGPKGSWIPTLQLIRNPRAAMENWVSRYGDPFLLNALNGPVVVTGRADLIREIHGQDPGIYETFATATLVPILGRSSLLAMEGEQHKRERRLIMPMFHGDRMKAYGSAMQAIALQEFSKRLEHNRIIPTLDVMTDISLEIIVRTVFGGENRQQTCDLMAASREVVKRSNPLLFFSKKTHLACWGLSPWDRFIAARARLFSLFDSIIDNCRNADVPTDHILSLLCSAKYDDGQPITREHIQEELLTFLFAGHETTALSMTWAIYHLLGHPEQLEKLKIELAGLQGEAAMSMATAPFLKACVQETLRIHPIVTETLRKLKTPMRLGEWNLPAGMAVAPATVLAHYNSQTYEEPDSFRPQRFIDRSYSPFEYMPFGGGHRRCIGAAFATFEMSIVLGSLFQRYEMELVESAIVVPQRRNVTMGPSSRVPIRVLKSWPSSGGGCLVETPIPARRLTS